MTLAAAVDALERADRITALEHLLEAWRVNRHPAIGDAIVILDVAFREAVGGFTQTEWLAAASAVRPAIVGALVHELALHAAVHSLKDIASRLERIARWPADPRVALALASVVEKRPWTTKASLPIWRQIMRVLAALRDPAIEDRLAVCRTRAGTANKAFREIYVAGIDVAVEVTQLSAQLDAADLARLARCRSMIDALRKGPLPAREVLAPPPSAPHAEVAPTEDDLLAWIAEDPASDGARQVLADYYLERDDPRGPVIALQLAGKQPKLTAPVIAALLGPLRDIVELGTARFERGGLAACTVTAQSPQELASAIGDPRWATVVELTTSRAAIVAQPHMRSLRVVRGLSISGLAELCRVGHALPVEEMTIVPTGHAIGTPPERATITAARCLPALRRLIIDLPKNRHFGSARIHLRDLDWLIASAFARGLDELVVTAEGQRTEYQLVDFANAFAAHASLGRLVIGSATFTRERGEIVLELVCPSAGDLDHFAARLTGLTGSHVAEVVVTSAKAPAASVRRRVIQELAHWTPTWRTG
ncbi:MAG: hypothetical protein H0T89_29980 [Deltaproteobacteria bacterium]|nr:hypothetical protein [Deltaproteobacteria bacterium]MDQ3301223.1 hypothetical protein [Myxococcota bacterium]